LGLAEIPEAIAQLTNLQTLYLSYNQLTSLPDAIAQLTNLQTLHLRNNQLTSLPDVIGQLSNLQTLHLRNNQLTSLPDVIGQLSNLQTLELYSNQLTSLPDAIGQLSNLQTLELYSNQLTSLPNTIGQLSNLQTLYLSYNQLTSLPNTIGQLSNLQTLELYSNPLNPLLQSACRQGLDELKAYLQSLSDLEKTNCLFEAKLVLVGEGNVGKTTLQKALTGQTTLENEPTTHGAKINIQGLQLPHPDLPGIKIQFNIWDFGGQDVYRVTHQFFFSPRSIYLVVWEPRRGVQQCQVEDWLKLIRLRVGDDARVIIVSTHCKTGERIARIDQPVLQQEYGSMIVGFQEVDSLVEDPNTGDKVGIPNLKTSIAAAAKDLSQMGMPFNRQWKEARDALLKLPQPRIPYSELGQICQTYGLDTLSTKTLTVLMHDLGYIVYYSDDERLQGEVILQPEWLTKAIGFVLEDRATQSADGVLPDDRLQQVWLEHPFDHEPRYEPSFYPFFLRIMERYDVLYRIESGTASLIAQHVPQVRPDLPWLPEDSPDPNRRRLALVCVLEEVPEGIVPWMIVRTHDFAHEYPQADGQPHRLHWQKGMFLRYNHHGEAFLELSDREFRIYAEANWPEYFINVLRQTLDTLITTTWPGLEGRYKFAVPCGENLNNRPCPGRFGIDFLRKSHQEGDTVTRCQHCETRRPIEQLLYGFQKNVIAAQLAQLSQSVMAVQQNLEELKSQIAYYVMAIMQAIATETKYGPSMFHIEPVKGNWRRLTNQRVRLHCWCEEEGCQHPIKDGLGVYEFDAPREWLIRVFPYIKLIAKVLKTVAAVAAPVADLALGESLMKTLNLQDHLEILKEGTDHTLEGDFEITESARSNREHLNQTLQTPIRESERSGLLAFHTLLKDLDPTHARLGLKRVRTYTGNYLWVCDRHYQARQSQIPDSFE
jgi:internalin A